MDQTSTGRSIQIETDLEKRRTRIEDFIARHFETQSRCAEELGLKQSRLSRALNRDFCTNRRLLPIERRISEWKHENDLIKTQRELGIPVFRLENGELRPVGDQEAVGTRYIKGANVDRAKLVYVEVTHRKHAVIELINREGVEVERLSGIAGRGLVEIAGLYRGQWATIECRFDNKGLVKERIGEKEDFLVFGVSVMKIEMDISNWTGGV
jgi:hypothetical protein